MKIFLVRHAESEQNTGEAKNIADSFIKITKRGETQAEDCANFLKEYCYTNNVDLEKSVIFVSPHKRTQQTAQIINSELLIKDVRYDYFLIERIFGVFDNMTKKERTKYLKKHKAYNKYYNETGSFYTQYPSGESVYDVVLRMKYFINFMLKSLDESIENVFIITHGYAISAFVMAYFNHLPEWLEKTFQMKNCSVRLIENSTDLGFIYGGKKE